jgi:alpha-D-xyloside xylohydrolase
MKLTRLLAMPLVAALSSLTSPGPAQAASERPTLSIESRALNARGSGALQLDGFFVTTPDGRTPLPFPALSASNQALSHTAVMKDGRLVTLAVSPEGEHHVVRLSAVPAEGILTWGLSIAAAPDEFFTGLMERVVDGPQSDSWAPGRREALDLRGQRVEMILKPTTSVYAPFFISSRGYATFVRGNWPGAYDFCAANPERVQIEWEGPSFEMKVYTAGAPGDLIAAHALDAGPPFMPPKWLFTPWRWRDQHSQLSEYYDKTPVTGPFNSQVMEDILMMKAFGIPCGVYWIDRPWGPGRLGYDDFEIDPKRLPSFPQMVKWLDAQKTKTVLWIGPFLQGQMEREGLAKGYTLAGQQPLPNNYPTVDFTNPAAKKYWQDGVAKLLKLGVAGFKLDRAEEDMPETGLYKTFDGRSIRENRNTYPVLYLRATYDVAKEHRGDDFALMPRAAYTGSSPYGVFWGGDIGGNQEGLRASIIAVQRAAVMGYPNWGSDTCGYGRSASMDQEVCGRWLAFSALTPIMEVGPTRNVGFWNLPRTPSYDPVLIAIWRAYADLHMKLVDYSYEQAMVAHRTGTPIVRPLFTAEPSAPEAWRNWWTYLYGPDLLVSPIWEQGKRTQEVYLPRGARWRDAWRPTNVYEGGKTITVGAELHQLPLFVREGSSLSFGDLERQYQDALALAQRRPNLAVLEAEVKAWYEAHGRTPETTK